MAKKPLPVNDPAYTIRRPGRPRKSESLSLGAAAPTAETVEPSVKPEAAPRKGQESDQGSSLRFEMRLPPGLVADLELMREHTGNTFAGYIRQAILRALAEDKKGWRH